MKSLRIGVLTATFPPYRAGTGNVVFSQAEELARRGHDVTVITATYPGVPEDPENVRVRRIEPMLRAGNAPFLPELLLLHGFDLLHLHQPFIFGAELGTTAALLRRTPLVSSIHNELVASGLRGALFTAYSRTALPLTLRASRIITSVTPGHAQAVTQVRTETSRRPEKLRIVQNAVDHHRFSPGPIDQDIRDQLRIPPDAKVAIVCAALDEAHLSKRVDVAIEAAALVEGLHLIVVGDGPLRAALERQAQNLNARHRTHFVGFQDEDLPAYYRAADVLVLSSELESFGLVQVEAMSCGRPVIVSDLPGARDVSIPGRHGWHVTPANVSAVAASLREVCGMPDRLLSQMGDSARQHVLANFTVASCTDALEAAFAAALR